jgi:Amt family ammonium transporter
LSIISIIVYKIADLLVGNRAPEASEIEGLDIPEMGLLGYNGLVFDRASETPHAK